MTTKDERSAARDFCMARLAACRAALSLASSALDDTLAHFVDTSDDLKGKERASLLEAIDEQIGEAARAVQAAQGAWSDVDPKEEEPELEEPDEDDDEDEEDEHEDD